MRSIATDTSGQAGFTVIELIVVVSIIAVLMSLILPAVISARAASRRAQCQNNLRNLGIAMIAQSHSAARFPASGNVGNNTTGPLPFHSWVVELLPWLDRHDIYSRWQFDSSQNSAPNTALAQVHLAVVSCPSDITVVGAGDLSYVVNGGFGWTSAFAGIVDCPVDPGQRPMDLNGNGITCPANPIADGIPADKLLYFQTAFFFLENWKVPGGTVRHHTPDDIVDGLSQTIMMAENVRGGFDPYFPSVNWADPDPRRNSFFVSLAVCGGASCSPGNVDYRRANQGPQGINAGREQPEGEAPWPSSYHTGGVYALYGDGHVKFLSQDVDGAVYAALVSPQGSRITGPLAQKPLSDADY